jgi:hypothetical protein
MFYYANKSNGMIAFIAFDLHVVFKCEKIQYNHTNVNSHFRHTLFLTWKVRFFIMKKYRRVTDVLLCKNNGMIASVAFDLHAVFKCEKIQQIMQMYTPS